ncbi:MAG TPA: ankyrin repeat domain-containing protein, partial [Candidatus Babeliales bacterium]|nr:ankyrin repeat domain-containing protein [Candidatus Babeliales bacterium]
INQLAAGFKALALAVFLASFCTAGTLLAAAVAPVTSVTPAPAAIATPADVPVASNTATSRSLAAMSPAATAATVLTLTTQLTVDRTTAMGMRNMALTPGEQEALLMGYLHLGDAWQMGVVFDAAKFTDQTRIKDRLILEHAIRLDTTETAECVQLLLDKGVQPRDLALAPRPPYAHYPHLPIILAIDLGKTAAARALIAFGGPQLSYNSPRYGGTPLMRAVANGNAAIVEALLACPTVDSFLNQRSYGSGRTALHMAVRSIVEERDKYDDYNEIAAALIAAGSNLRMTNHSDYTARDLAVRCNNAEVLYLIDERQAVLDRERKAAEKAALAEQKAREQAAKAALAAQKARAKAMQSAAKAPALLTDIRTASDFTGITVVAGAPALDQRGTGRHRWLPGFLGGDRR